MVRKDYGKVWDEIAIRMGLQSVMSVRWSDKQCKEETRKLKKVMRYMLADRWSEIKSVLEIGCGVGRTTEFFTDIGVDVTAIDVSKKMIEKAKKNPKLKNVKFIVGDFSKWVFGRTRFDLVTAVTVLEHITDEVDFVRSIKRIKELSDGYVLLCEELTDVKTVVGYSDNDVIRSIKLYLEIMNPEFSLIRLERVTCIEDGYCVMLFSKKRNWRYL